MSIFKSTFKEGVYNQIKKRQEAINDRTPTNLTYYNSRNAWVRMTSAVGQYNGSGDIEDGANYSNTLANQFVLQGGILDPNKNLRSGLGIDGAYSNISPTGVEYRLGIRPMPGITSVDVKTKSAYGSLREAVVTFNCWDIHQLEELELLYMRPGYSVMLEWGWSPYLKNDGTLETNVQFLDDVLNAQNGTPSKEEVWEKAFNKSSDINEGGNYEALYGFVKNYSWKARMDGGYDCTTTIISIGEILESLKINYGAFKADVGTYGTFKDPNMSTPFKEESNLGKSYAKNALAGIINELYLIAQGNFGGSYNSGGTFELSDITEATVNAIKTIEAPVINIITSVYQAATGQEVTAYDPKTESKSIEIGGETYDFFAFEVEVENADDKIKDSDFTAGNYQIYITLEGFIKILNKYVTIHDSQNETPIVEISLTEGKHMENPGAPLLCLGDKLQMSTNPSVCLIKNTAWSNPEDVGLEDGFFTDFTTFKKLIKHLDKNYWYNEDYSKKQLGVIGNIYVNLAYLYSLVVNEDLSSKDKKEKNDISVFDYLKNVMAGINTAIGNVATFDISIDSQDSKARIIDVNYVDSTERDVAYENAAIIEMQNLISTVRSYSFESQIFPEQSTMVAIGAQVKGGAIGENTETLIDFNQKLIDRVIPKKDAPLPQTPPEDPELKRKEELKNLKTNLEILTKYINKLDPSWIESTGEFDVNEAGKYSNALKDIINYFKSLLKDDNKNRAIIPTKLSIEMDGISGMIIGNLFRIREELMPRGYKGDGAGPAKIGYVVTRLGHTISNNDWKTKIEAQFIIFDEPRGEGSYLDLKDIKTINESALNTDIEKSGSASSFSKIVTKAVKSSQTGGATKVFNNVVRKNGEVDDLLVRMDLTLEKQHITHICQSDGARVRLQAKAMQNLEQMVKDATKDGINLGINSAYRTRADQDRVWGSNCSNAAGSGKCIPVEGKQPAASPGTSNHGFGLAVDLANASGTRINPDKTPKEWKWIQENKAKYSFENINNTNESHHYNFIG
jgi:LAS superfamily LD-carboxypeptidase LdcB